MPGVRPSVCLVYSILKFLYAGSVPNQFGQAKVSQKCDTSLPIYRLTTLTFTLAAVLIPVSSKTTIAELKSAFIEAVSATDDPRGPDDDKKENLIESNIKLWKAVQSDDGEESWSALEDRKTTESAGLEQGHTVGVSFVNNGKRGRSDVLIEKADVCLC